MATALARIPTAAPKPAPSAVEMGARQRDISVSEFFTKNRHLLGFDNPRKALLTCVKEAVDNALDAAEEAGILPEVVVTLEVAPANGEAPPPASQATRFRVTVIDNGPGIVRQRMRIGRTNATSAGAAGVRPGPGAPGGGSAMAASRGEPGMADRKKVAEKDGAHRTNRATVELGYVLADGYKFAATDEKEIGDTGCIKVLRVGPSDEQSTAPRFLGRWDDGPAQRLDFDLVDKNDNRVHKRKLPYGHHPKILERTGGHRRYQVELGRDKDNIVFRGVVQVSIGFRIRLRGLDTAP